MRVYGSGAGWIPGPRAIIAARLIVVAAWGLLGPCGGAIAQQHLRWDLKPGETLRYSIDQKMILETRGQGVERRSDRTNTLEFTWKVLSVAPGGEAEISHRTERIRMKAEEPPFMPFEFDSSGSKEAQPGFEALARALKAEVGAEFVFKMKPNGEITDIKVPEATLKRLREAAPEGAEKSEISGTALKDTLIQASPPSFPESPLKLGETWTTRPARMPVSLPGPNPPLATLILDRTFHYQGPDSASPAISFVRVDTRAKVEPIEGIDVKVTIRKQEGSGSMTVDTQAGRVVGTKLGLKLELLITGKGQSIEQSSESSSTMTLLK